MTHRIVIIGGCGHVGLPLGISLAQVAGNRVDLVDTNSASVEAVSRGEILFEEKGGKAALRQVIGKSLFVHSEGDCLRQADVVVFVTGTPVDEHLNPRISDIIQVIEQYREFLNSNQLIVLRSTVYPGVTRLVYEHLKQRMEDPKLAFCPERVAQGLALEEIKNFPQVVSAFDSTSEQRAAAIFRKISKEVLFLSPEEAELSKLFSNSWRYLEFAIANQHYMISEANGADFYRIYEALTHEYPRAATFRKAGLAAGPCLFKDTMQLSAFFNNQFFLGHAAMLINEGLPNFLVGQLEKSVGNLAGKKIGLLGMAFKPNNDDTRESLSYKIKKILESKMAIVLDTDVYQPTHRLLPSILNTADAFILATPHHEYRDVELHGKPFVDCWGVWRKGVDLSKPLQPNSTMVATEEYPSENQTIVKSLRAS